MLRRINQSEMTTWMRCPRKWNLSYLQGFEETKKSAALETGSLVHLALEAHYAGGDALKELDAWLIDQLASVECEQGYDMEPFELARIMVEGYLEWLEETGEDADLKPELVEHQLETQLHGVPWLENTPYTGVQIHGTLDWTARDSLGRLLLVDHKTTASFAVLANRRLCLSFQLLTYAWLYWQVTGERPAGVAYNMLRKVKRTARAKPPFYIRETINFNYHQLENHEKHLRQVVGQILMAERLEAVNYPVPDQDCGWKCPFLQICPLLDDGSDAVGALEALYVRRDGRN